MLHLRLALLALTLLASFGASAETRLALVIGNSDYASGPLTNPSNDAKMMSDTLGALRFEVIRRTNADQNTMKRAIQEFGARLEKGGAQAVGLFYYAGHGIQLNGRNFLIPTNAHIDREGDVEIEAVSADWVLEQMRYARNGLNIVILDACRNNPFVRSMRSANQGLAVIDAPAGILIAYSTSPGSVAADGSGKNSPYTEALSKAMLSQREPVEQLFKHVRVGVMNSTQGKQVPWESSSLTGDFYFQGGAALAATVPPQNPVGAAPGSARASPSDSSSGGVSGFFANLLRGSADATPPKTQAANAPPKLLASSGAATVAGARALLVLQPLGVEAGDIVDTKNYALAEVRQLIEKSPRRVNLGNNPQQIDAAFKMCQKNTAEGDCDRGWYSDEIIRAATLAPFDIDLLPVSVAAFRQFVEASHYVTTAEKRKYALFNVGGHLSKIEGGNWRNGVNRHGIADDAAVVGVSFEDAQAYCRFRNQRLPSENEWEYVARGGSERRTFPWGESELPARATPPNRPKADEGPAGGIGDRYRGLSGNVWQWVDSRYDKEHKVLKGGSWLERNPANKRNASRRGELPDNADDDSGFRCARALPAWPDAEFWMAQLR